MEAAWRTVPKFVAAPHQRNVTVNPNSGFMERHRLRYRWARDGFQHFRLGLIHRRRVAVCQVRMVDLVERGDILFDSRLRHGVERGHDGFFVFRVVDSRRNCGAGEQNQPDLNLAALR